MGGVLIGFAIIVAVIGVGYLIGRFHILGPHANHVLSRLAFFVLSPALLFTVLAEANVTHLFSALLPISAIAAAVNIAGFLVVSLLIWRRGLPEATSAAPVLLLQLIVLAPIALTILDVTTSGTLSVKRVLLQPVRNPLIIGSLLGVIVAGAHLKIPVPVMAPLTLIGGAAVPVILMGFGMSLHGSRVLAPGTSRKDVILASALKLAAMPVVAWLLAHFVWHLEGHRLFVVVVLAALPTAQNVFNYAQRYGRGVTIARDTALITTALSIVALVVIAALLAPG
jgi:malonate transporter